MTDPKALRILFKTYWSSAGWKRDFNVSPEDFEYAREAGTMFDPVYLSHDGILQWMARSLEHADPEQISNAFLASLSTRRLDLRSALGSYATARNFPSHAFQGSEFFCYVCGIYPAKQAWHELSILSFERYKWGGVRHDHPTYIAFDLEQFQKTEKVQPTAQDFAMMKQILLMIKNCEPQARPRDLEKRLSKIIVSNKNEREMLIQILAYCGILEPRKHPSYLRSFTHYVNRTSPNVAKMNWTYPVSWWRGSDGLNASAVQTYFPQIL